MSGTALSLTTPVSPNRHAPIRSSAGRPDTVLIGRLGSSARSQGLRGQTHTRASGQTPPDSRRHRARRGPRYRAPLRARWHARAPWAPATRARLPRRGGPGRALEHRAPPGLPSHRGRRRPQPPARLGLAAMASRASRWPGAWGSRARMVRLAARTVSVWGEPLRAGGLQGRPDPAGVDAVGGPLALEPHAAPARPRPGRGLGRVAARALAPSRAYARWACAPTAR